MYFPPLRVHVVISGQLAVSASEKSPIWPAAALGKLQQLVYSPPNVVFLLTQAVYSAHVCSQEKRN